MLDKPKLFLTISPPVMPSYSAIDGEWDGVSNWADFFELNAFFSVDGRIYLNEYFRDYDYDRVSVEDGIDLDEATVKSTEYRDMVNSEIELRCDALKDLYPFGMSADGIRLELHSNWENTPSQSVYLLCLLLSQICKEGLCVSLVDSAAVVQARRLFALCSSVAAAGLCGGTSFYLDYPRLDRTTLLEKINQVFSAFPESSPVSELPPGTSGANKDDKVDVIAWRVMPDRRAGTILVIGQSASGANWKEKSVKSELEAYIKRWVAKPGDFRTKPMPVTMIPFRIESRHEWDFQTSRHGIILDRLRIPHFLDIAIKAKQMEDVFIEGRENLDKIGEWLKERKQESEVSLP